MQRILFVEDDPDIGQLIAGWLSRHEMEVILEPRGDRALARVEEVQPDLVLLDIMLPGCDGLSLCRDLRPRFAGPIVMLTSLDSDMNQILSLELGANDYILKTTPPPVLLARLRVQFRQQQRAPQALAPVTVPQRLQLGGLTIDGQARSVTLDGVSVSLSTSDFDLLWELACHAGQIMGRDALFRRLRGRDYDGLDRSMDVAISRLRRKLGDDPADPTRIKTVRQRGYLLVPQAWE
ncbi:two-component system response regulator RstA [Aeromonas schubertii]|uniref:two-component system response regulator RstA n=1 Tax=Aeromonas schubertii TaxID=652 RepID=UPI0010A77F3F|nr:two-component system response regulator RstA [Aeromonas schubertii]MBZ6073779.1 two-component system response regulator RstA [Aeromonas schubertii]QCG46562.1 two-component system response regulator RstA [Aeromonas schubertii]